MPSSRPHARDLSKPRLTTGQMARRFRVTLQTLYHYEEQGLLVPSRNGSTREYDDKAVERLAFILAGKRQGLSLAKIAALVAAEAAAALQSGGDALDALLMHGLDGLTIMPLLSAWT